MQFVLFQPLNTMQNLKVLTRHGLLSNYQLTLMVKPCAFEVESRYELTFAITITRLNMQRNALELVNFSDVEDTYLCYLC